MKDIVEKLKGFSPSASGAKYAERNLRTVSYWSNEEIENTLEKSKEKSEETEKAKKKVNLELKILAPASFLGIYLAGKFLGFDENFIRKSIAIQAMFLTPSVLINLYNCSRISHYYKRFREIIEGEITSRKEKGYWKETLPEQDSQ